VYSDESATRYPYGSRREQKLGCEFRQSCALNATRGMRVEAQKNAQLAVSLACRISLVAAVVLITSSDLLHHLPRSSTLFYLGLLVAFDLAASVAYHVCSKAVHAQRSLPDEEMRRLPDVEGEVCKRYTSHPQLYGLLGSEGERGCANPLTPGSAPLTGNESSQDGHVLAISFFTPHSFRTSALWCGTKKTWP